MRTSRNRPTRRTRVRGYPWPPGRRRLNLGRKKRRKTKKKNVKNMLNPGSGSHFASHQLNLFEREKRTHTHKGTLITFFLLRIYKGRSESETMCVCVCALLKFFELHSSSSNCATVPAPLHAFCYRSPRRIRCCQAKANHLTSLRMRTVITPRRLHATRDGYEDR